jgi:hypothetical protein
MATIGTAVLEQILCGACGTLPLYPLSDGDFACPDDHAITIRELLMDPGETWGVSPAGHLVFLPETEAAAAVDLAAPTVIICAECCTHPFTATAAGLYVCQDGHEVATRDLVLDPGETWCVTPAGHLAYVADPAAAQRRMDDARDVMESGATGWDLDDAHAEYAEGLAALRAARAAGLALAKGGQR